MSIGKRTTAQIAAARRNCAKSKGPLSLEGKAAVALNAFKHGFTAKSILVPGESEDRFNELLHSFVHAFQPQTDAEFFCVEEMAAKWRTRRMWGYESRTLAHGAADPDTPAEFRSVLAWERKLTQVEGCQR